MNLNALQVSKGPWHAGLTESNHLSRAFLTQPEMASTLVTHVYAMMTGSNPMDYLTKGMGRTKEMGNREYQWPLMGDSRKAIAIVGTLGDGGATPGIGRQTFRVVLPEKLFVSGDNVVFDDRAYTARIQEDPYQLGVNWVYTLKLKSTDNAKFVPANLLANGAQLSKDYSTYSEFSDRGGSTTFATPFMMRNHMTTLRKEYTITRSAMTDVLTISLPDPSKSGKTATMWVNYAEWVAMSQWFNEVEKSLWYSTFSANAQGVTDIKGSNGLPVYEGAGIRQQIAPANKRTYTKLTEKIIRDFLIDLSYNVSPDSQRKFVAFTGEYGFAEFDRAMKDSASTFTLVDSKFITGSGQELALGGQFVTYRGLNGTEITLKHLPLYDDVVDNRRLHPETGRPLESYRFTILDFGINGGESNIVKVHKKDSEFVSWYIEGSCGPMGTKKNSSSSSSIDGYTTHMLSECGIMIKNPTSCGELICDAA